jgi:hypothetical protein
MMPGSSRHTTLLEIDTPGERSSVEVVEVVEVVGVVDIEIEIEEVEAEVEVEVEVEAACTDLGHQGVAAWAVAGTETKGPVAAGIGKEKEALVGSEVGEVAGEVVGEEEGAGTSGEAECMDPAANLSSRHRYVALFRIMNGYLPVIHECASLHD